MKKLIAVIVVVIVLAAAAAPYVIGMKFEGQFKQKVAQLSHSLHQPIKIENYNRGWLGSSAQLEFKVHQEPVVVNLDITHGPYAVFGLARVTATPKFKGNKAREKLHTYFGGSPATLSAVIGFNGGVNAHLSSPALKKPISKHGTEVKWKGLEAEVDYHNGRITYKLNAPYAFYHIPGKTILVKGVNLSGSKPLWLHSQLRVGHPEDWKNHANVSIKRVKVDDNSGGIHFKLTLNGFGKGTLDNSGHLKEHSKFHVTKTSFEKRGAPAINIKDGVLTISLNGLRAKPVIDLLKGMRRIQDKVKAAGSYSEKRAADKQMRSLIVKGLPKVLADQPKLVVEIPKLQMNGGKLNAKVAVVMKKQKDGMPQPGALFMLMARLSQRLQVDGHAFAGKNLVQWAVQQASTPARAEQALAKLQAKNLIRKENGGIATKVHYEQGHLVINGQQMSPLMLKRLF